MPERDKTTVIQKTVSIPKSLSEVTRLVQEKPAIQKDAPSLTLKSPPSEADPQCPAAAALDQPAIQEVLDKIIFEFKEKGKHMEMAVIRQPFTVEGNRILFLLDGGIQKDIFEKIKPALTGMLKRSLQPVQLEVAFQIKPPSAGAAGKLYTSTDKLRYLREKSPALKELQKRFGLETDF